MTIKPGKPRVQCPHLREPTGEFVTCRTCAGGTVNKIPIYRCAIEGVTVLSKPLATAGHKPWDGVNCLTCIHFPPKEEGPTDD